MGGKQTRSRSRGWVVAIGLTITLGLAGTACSGGGSGSLGRQGLCFHLVDFQNILTDAKNGTLTNEELVTKLDRVENNISDDAAVLQSDGDSAATAGQNLATAIGHWKVAVSNEDQAGTDAAIQELGPAVSALPTCS